MGEGEVGRCLLFILAASRLDPMAMAASGDRVVSPHVAGVTLSCPGTVTLHCYLSHPPHSRTTSELLHRFFLTLSLLYLIRKCRLCFPGFIS
jgi:hypothetical protein